VGAPAEAIDGTSDLADLMRDIGMAAKKAARNLALAPAHQKHAALSAMAQECRARTGDILAANAQDLAEAAASGASKAFLDRLALDQHRVAAIASGIGVVRDLEDPVGRVTDHWIRPNGMRIERVRVPLGVIGIIYESRPNVTADAAALSLKAGNAAILRGGSESQRTNRAIHAALSAALRKADLPEAAISLVPTRERAAVGMMLAGLEGAIDVIVPRGGKSLVARVQQEARVPVFAHLEGICHVYVEAAANLDMAKAIVLNAKMRRTGVCGAAETLLVEAAAAGSHLRPLVSMLLDAGCEVGMR
jgi:glutamate-5-semialdehyde dehydrogenase